MCVCVMGYVKFVWLLFLIMRGYVLCADYLIWKIMSDSRINILNSFVNFISVTFSECRSQIHDAPWVSAGR